jgi:hypothetical protein
MGGEKVFGRLARGAYLIALALMIAAYAMSAATTRAPEPQPKPPQTVEHWYC